MDASQLLALTQASHYADITKDVTSEFMSEAQYNYSQYVRSIGAMQMGASFGKMPEIGPETTTGYDSYVTVDATYEWIKENNNLTETLSTIKANYDAILAFALKQEFISNEEKSQIYKILDDLRSLL